jgi:hypothetical protein
MGVLPLVHQRGPEDEALCREGSPIGDGRVEGVRFVHESGDGDAHGDLGWMTKKLGVL